MALVQNWAAEVVGRLGGNVVFPRPRTSKVYRLPGPATGSNILQRGLLAIICRLGLRHSMLETVVRNRDRLRTIANPDFVEWNVAADAWNDYRQRINCS